MTEAEVKEVNERVAQFNRLTHARDKAYEALKAVTENWEHGPHGQGPFTGNTRESRQVAEIEIRFTPTRGGAPGVTIKVCNLYLEAYEFGNYLKGELEKRLKKLNEEIEKI